VDSRLRQGISKLWRSPDEIDQIFQGYEARWREYGKQRVYFCMRILVTIALDSPHRHLMLQDQRDIVQYISEKPLSHEDPSILAVMIVKEADLSRYEIITRERLSWR
jgi:hypothetical protein